MYEEKKIVYDKKDRIKCGSTLEEEAVIYRISSPHHANKDDAFSGDGCAHSSYPGRFNAPQQRAVYCSNNIILCISEILFHNYRTTLNRIKEKFPPEMIREKINDKKALIIARTSQINELVYLDSKDFYREYGLAEVQGTWLVHPDVTYPPHQIVSNLIREKNKNGILYPSARHSRDVAIALFRDVSTKIREDEYYTLEINLVLVAEDTPPDNCAFSLCDPTDQKLHFTMGYYSIEDQDEFERLKSKKYINPINMKPFGMIDFVRRKYKDYPNDAILTKKFH